MSDSPSRWSEKHFSYVSGAQKKYTVKIIPAGGDRQHQLTAHQPKKLTDSKTEHADKLALGNCAANEL